MRSYCSLKLSLVLALFFIGFCFLVARADEKSISAKDNPAETKETVSSAADTTDPLKMALEEFHQVMAPLWHQAFPKKDFKTVREKAPLLQEKLMNLLRLKNPAYLEKDEEKLDSFLSKRQELAFQVSQVNLAAKDTVDSTLASNFEKMHWAYEELEKVFAVPIKELDKFHETLYYLWHKALPGKDYDAIKETIPVLKAEVDSLTKAPLPYGCAKKKDEFEKKKSALKDAVYQLAESSQKGGPEDIDKSLVAVHEKFVELNLFLR
jgi:hypothetical protein